MRISKIVVAIGFLAVATAGGQTISWIQQFGVAGSQATALTADPSGIYVAVNTPGPPRNAFISKYDSAGILLVSRQLQPGYGAPLAWAVTTAAEVTPEGTVAHFIYVAGVTQGGTPSAFIRKYDADLNAGSGWTQRFGTSGEEAFALTAGADGIYVAGDKGADFGLGIDAFVRKYSFDGVLLWTDTFGGGEDTSNFAFALTADVSGIYVAGIAGGILPGSSSGGDAFVRKYAYDAKPNVLWTEQFTSIEEDVAWALTAGADGIYVGGWTLGMLDGFSNAGGADAFVRKYDANGVEMWGQQFGTDGDDYANALTVGSDGIYVAGVTHGALKGFSNPGGADAFVQKYAFNYTGIVAPLWTRQFGTATDDGVFALTAGPDGIYVAGSTNGTLVSGQTGGAFLAKIPIPIAPATPLITWSNPPGMIFGSALGSGQLNATANVLGAFSYSPPAGTVLPQGLDTLSVVFTPNDAINYSSTSASVVVNVVAGPPIGQPQFVVTRTLSRDSSNNIAVAVTVTNTGGQPANLTGGPYLALGTCKLGSASPLAVVGPPAGNTIAVPPGASAHWTVTFPGSTGTPGATMLLTVNGTWRYLTGAGSTSGSFGYTSRTVLP